MKITPELIDRLAELAKLEFDAEEKAALIPELEKITGFMDKLRELDVENTEPLVYLSETRYVLSTPHAESGTEPHLRADEPKAALPHDLALKNAPKKDSDYFRVPKVLDKSEG